MNIATRSKSNIAAFEPEEAKARISALDAAILHAKTMKDWEALEKAVAIQVDEQRLFVKWWEGNVVTHGGNRKSKSPVRDLDRVPANEAETATGITPQQVSKWRKRLATPDKYRDALFGVAYKNAMAEEHNHRAQGTGENEWYTPTKYVELARTVLGTIDLDPASSAKAQETVQAARYITAAENGLTKEWKGRVWLNPPYAQPAISEFITKMVGERCAERVTAGIMLTHNYTDTAWFHEAADIADAICFTRGRIKFVDANGGECAPTQGQAFFYYGSDVKKFTDEFKSIGLVVVPWVQPNG